MTHVLLFGASGFLGAHVRDALHQEARVARITAPGRDRCDLLAGGVDEVVDLVRETHPDVVINCTGRLDGSPSELIRANTLVSAKLVDALAVAGAGIRFVRVGSAGEYGPVPYGHAVRESDPAAPASEYGLSHLAATRLVELAATAGRVDGITLRVFNPVGTGMRDGTVLGRAVVRLREALATRAPAVTMGPLSAYRDFVDARDVATAIVAAALVRQVTDRVLNVGSGQSVSVRTAVSALAQTAGFTGEIREQGSAVARSAAVDWMLADTSRAAEVLGWRPAYDLGDSAKAIWAEAMGAAAR
jgi:nucleoside-diphosphate-sugar epimerase